ncbi:hypothetical protein [Campylobacter coli]|uniref:hypothetical protein n=1 Tax=Campylobacter coli TaxID=195 RepID=UPI000A50DC17|nr:hypothetical protein [Campylobacter coli]
MFKPTDLENVKYNIKVVKEKAKFVYYIVLEREVNLESIQLYLENDSICNSFQKIIIEGKSEYKKDYKNIASENIYFVDSLKIDNICKKICYIRMYLMSGEYFKIKKFLFLAHKYLKMIISGRTDGFGARMFSLLNAYYLAKESGNGFAFVWPSSLADKNLRALQGEQNIDNSVLVGFAMDSENNIFEKKFIERYSYTGIFKVNKGESFPAHSNYRKIFTKESENNIIYINSAPLNIVFDDIDEKKYRGGMKDIWNALPFTPTIKFIISMANKLAGARKFISVHIRSGDVVFGDGVKELMNSTFRHAMPIELAMAIIEENIHRNYNIVIFGEDLTSLKKIKEYYQYSPNVFLISDFIPENRIFSTLEQVFFELTFMSFSKEIYTTRSSVYSRFAFYIGMSEKLINIYEYFSPTEQYNFLNKKEKIYQSDLQAAYSTFHLFRLSREMKYDFSLQKKYIQECIKLDPNNFIFKILLLDLYLELKKYKDADNFLGSLKIDSKLKFVKLLLNKENKNIIQKYLRIPSVELINHKNILQCIINIISATQIANESDIICNFNLAQNPFLQAILKDNETKLIQISALNKTVQEKDNVIKSNSTQLNQLQSKISFQIQYGTAKSRIQNQLSYKLGQAMIINSKNIFSILFMPVYIISTLLSHRQEEKIYQEKIKKNPNLKLPPLESYPDYKEALKEKECLTYKLGEALIRANNNWYGGGYIKLLLEIRKLKREFRKEK